MKEKDIREKLNTFKSNLPMAVVAYACGFPSQTYLYAAPMPEEYGKWTDVYQPWTIKPFTPVDDLVPEPAKVESSKVDKCELNELIDAVLELKGQTVEIFKLKALAIAIKERNA